MPWNGVGSIRGPQGLKGDTGNTGAPGTTTWEGLTGTRTVPTIWEWTGTALPTSNSQVNALAQAGDMIVAKNLTTAPGIYKIT